MVSIGKNSERTCSGVRKLLTPLAINCILLLIVGTAVLSNVNFSCSLRLLRGESSPAKETDLSAGSLPNQSNNWEIEELPIMNSISRGFHPVYVYSKAVPPKRERYSQANQDNIILALIKADNEAAAAKSASQNNAGNNHDASITQRPPFFVDLASNEALVLSNTYLLEQNGWNGLCLEPNPIYWYSLASFRKCVIVAAFVGGTPQEDGKEVDVNLEKKAFGGIVGEGMDNLKHVEGAQKRNLVSISTVFKETNVPKVIDYMSLDVEGAETLVMNDFPWDSYIFRFITIERPKTDLEAMLNEHGYSEIQNITSWGETVWAHNSATLTKEAMLGITKDLAKGTLLTREDLTI